VVAVARVAADAVLGERLRVLRRLLVLGFTICVGRWVEGWRGQTGLVGGIGGVVLGIVCVCVCVVCMMGLVA